MHREQQIKLFQRKRKARRQSGVFKWALAGNINNYKPCLYFILKKAKLRDVENLPKIRKI